MMQFYKIKLVLAVLLPTVGLSACSTLSGPEELLLDIPNHQSAEEALRDHVELYEMAKRHDMDTAVLRLEVEKLADEYPGSVAVLKKNAQIAFDHGDNQKAAAFLDRLYLLDRGVPEAAVMRSQLALKNGKRALSKQILEKQMKLTPDYSPLYESMGAVLYFEKKYEEAKEALERAYKLGAPRNRINYHLGLITEAMGNNEKAMKHYSEALRDEDPFEAAEPRLAALKALR